MIFYACAHAHVKKRKTKSNKRHGIMCRCELFLFCRLLSVNGLDFDGCCCFVDFSFFLCVCYRWIKFVVRLRFLSAFSCIHNQSRAKMWRYTQQIFKDIISLCVCLIKILNNIHNPIIWKLNKPCVCVCLRSFFFLFFVWWYCTSTQTHAWIQMNRSDLKIRLQLVFILLM